MATPPQVTPPPGAQAGSPPPSSESPAQPNAATQKVIQIVRLSRELAKDFPETASEVRQVNDLIQKINQKIAMKSQPSEAQAPPV